MNSEAVSVALLEVINKVTSGVEKAIEFGAEQIPDILMQLILFNTVWNSIVLVVLGVITFLFYKWVKSFKNKEIEEEDVHTHDFNSWLWSTAFSFWILFGGLFFMGTTKELAKLTLAPKIWLIEYAADLASGNKDNDKRCCKK